MPDEITIHIKADEPYDEIRVTVVTKIEDSGEPLFVIRGAKDWNDSYILSPNGARELMALLKQHLEG